MKVTAIALNDGETSIDDALRKDDQSTNLIILTKALP